MKSKRYMRKYIFLSLIVLNFIFTAQAKSWHASYFGIRSDGMTDNTASFQKALDWISSLHPGDTLDIRVGRISQLRCSCAPTSRFTWARAHFLSPLKITFSVPKM